MFISIILLSLNNLKYFEINSISIPKSFFVISNFLNISDLKTYNQLQYQRFLIVVN